MMAIAPGTMAARRGPAMARFERLPDERPLGITGCMSRWVTAATPAGRGITLPEGRDHHSYSARTTLGAPASEPRDFCVS